jgi:hypothetical protein
MEFQLNFDLSLLSATEAIKDNSLNNFQSSSVVEIILAKCE